MCLDNLGLQTCGDCRGRSSSLFEIMQIVTSAVRIDVALTLSRLRSLFASKIRWSDVLSAHGHPHAKQVAFVGNSLFFDPVWQDTVSLHGLDYLRSPFAVWHCAQQGTCRLFDFPSTLHNL